MRIWTPEKSSEMKDDQYFYQDLNRYYFGAGTTLKQLMESDLVPIKLQVIYNRYLQEDTSLEMSMADFLSGLQAGSIKERVLSALKMRVHVMLPQEKQKGLFREKIMTVKEWDRLKADLAGEWVLREIELSKRALLFFEV